MPSCSTPCSPGAASRPPPLSRLPPTLVLLLSLWRPRRRVGPLTITAIDVAAIGALVAVVLALVRGSADSASIAQEQGTGVFLLLLPGLVAFVAAVLGVRLLPPILRLLERSTRRSVVPLRLAAVSLARNPGRSAIAVVVPGRLDRPGRLRRRVPLDADAQPV